MDGLSRAILSGSATALSLAKTLVTLPRLLWDGYTVFLEVTEHTQHGEAIISENLIVTAGGDNKRYIADNVAPSAWTWILSGYIPAVSFINPTALLPFLAWDRKEKLKSAYKGGKILTFYDIDRKIYENVVIQSLDIKTEADCGNKVPFSMTLKEINIMNTTEAGISELAKKAQPPRGSDDGLPADLGKVQSKEVNPSLVKESLNTLGFRETGDGVVILK